MAADFRIQGYERNDGSHAQFLVVQGPQLHAKLPGLTLEEAKMVIEDHLRAYLDSPEVAVDVYAYNSKRYYVVLQGAGFGDAVYTFPVTGNETITGAIAGASLPAAGASTSR